MTDLRAHALGLLAAVALCACGGTTQSVSPLTLPTAVPTASPSPAGPSTTTLSVGAGAASATLPAVNGAVPTVAFNAVSPPAGASIAVTVSSTAPTGFAALQSAARTTRSVTRTTLAYVTWVPSTTIVLQAFPQYTFAFPQSLVPAGTTLHEAFLDGSTAQPVYQIDVAFGPNGATLTSSASAPTLQAGKTYIFAIYLETGATASPSPTPTAGPSASPSPVPTASATPSAAPSASPAPGAFLKSPVTITKVADGFPVSGAFYDGQMTLAGDGKLWLADQRTQAIRPLDPVTRVLGTGYKFIPPGATASIRPGNLALGPDGRLWIVTFDDTSNIYAMSLNGTLQKYDSRNPAHTNYVNRLVAGADGRMWGISADSVRAFTTSGAISVYPLPVTTRTGNDCPSITLNPDGNVWYVCRDAVGKVTPSGQITEYKGNGNTFIGAGPDGSVWIKGSGLTVARVSPDGTYKEFPLPVYESSCTSIVRGPDNDMYLGCSGTLFRITSTGASAGTITLLADYRTPNYTTGFAALTVGPDAHSLWTANDLGYAQLIQ